MLIYHYDILISSTLGEKPIEYFKSRQLVMSIDFTNISQIQSDVGFNLYRCKTRLVENS